MLAKIRFFSGSRDLQPCPGELVTPKTESQQTETGASHFGLRCMLPALSAPARSSAVLRPM